MSDFKAKFAAFQQKAAEKSPPAPAPAAKAPSKWTVGGTGAASTPAASSSTPSSASSTSSVANKFGSSSTTSSSSAAKPAVNSSSSNTTSTASKFGSSSNTSSSTPSKFGSSASSTPSSSSSSSSSASWTERKVAGPATQLVAKAGGKGLGLAGLDEKQLEDQMKNLGAQTKNKRAARKVARNKDTIHTLLDAMKTKPKFTKMVEYSVECLKNLAVDEVSVEEMIEEGTLEVLMDIMKLNPYNEKLQQQINACIQAFALNDYLASLIAERMGPKAFIFSLNKHVEPTTLVGTIGAVNALFKHEKNVDMFVGGGIIPALRHVVKNSEEQPEVLTKAAECLSRVCNSKANANEIMASGVVEDILNALKNYPENRELVKYCLDLITKLAKMSPEIAEMLKKMGAVDMIVEALEAHPDDEELTRLGAEALKYLSGDSDVGGAMSVKMGLNAATAAALAKISQLLLVDDNVDYMINNEGIAWLLSALKLALGDKSEVASKILVSGCRALMRMANDENKIYSIMQLGGVKLLISIIEQHVEDENVVCAALGALTKMVTRKENAIFIVKSGGIQAAHAALNQHPKSERVAKQCLEFFQRIAAHEECVPMLVANGVIQDVIDILKNHGKNPEIALACINTLGRMAISAENMQLITDAGGLQALVNVLQDQKDDLNVAKQALLMLETSALLPKNIEALRNIGAMDAILGAMEAHPDDGEMQNIGSRTIAMIAGEAQLKQAVEHVGQLANTLTNNPKNIDKLLNAVKLLGNLALVDANVDFLVKNGAVAALIAAFNAAAKLPASEKRDKVMIGATQGLSRLGAKSPVANSEITKLSGLKHILPTSNKEKDNEELAEEATKLAPVLTGTKANHKKLIDDGAIPDLINAAKGHPLNEKVLANVTRALGDLACTDELAKKIANQGGSEVVVESIFANLENPELLTNALQALNALCTDEASIQALINAGAIDAILEAMRVHHNNPEILALCAASLCRLLISEKVANDIGEKGGMPILVKAMRDHYAHEPLCEVDMILMDSCASVPANAGRLLEPELATVELINWISDAFPKNEPLQEAYKKLLATLTGPKERKPSLTFSNEDFDEAKCDILLNKFKNNNLDKQECLNMLHNLHNALQDPKNAEMMVSKGGLQTLAQLMAKNKDDEDIFYAASAAFLDLCENGGENVFEMLEEPALIAALCSMMNAHEIFPTPMNLADLTKAVAATAKIKLKPASVTELLKNKPLNSLMKILVQSDDPMLLTQAARLLGKLSNNPDAALLLSKLANLRELIMAMRRNMDNPDFLKYAVYLLANLAVNEDLKSEIGIEGGIQVILQVMDKYPMDEGLIENCTYALANLSFGNESNVAFIVACKGIGIILSSMHNHGRAEDLLESAVCTLCNLCPNNNNNKDLIVKAGGAQAIVDTVLNNFNSVDLLITCFRTLGNLAYNAKNISTIIKAGGVQGIVAGMTVHNEELDVIDVAIRVLTNLASDPNEENMAILAKEGAVQAIVEVAGAYYDKLEIEIAALGCLINLGRVVDNASMIVRQGGTEATVKTMKTLDFDATLIQKAVTLLSCLAYSTEDAEHILDAGATECIVAAIKQHNTNRSVVSPALIATAQLSFNEELADRMGTHGIIQTILRLASDSMKEPATLAESFNALGALCRSEQNAISMSELAMKSLVVAFNTHATDPKLIAHGFAFLTNLCVHPQASDAIMNTDMVSTSCDTIIRHRGNADLIIRGLRALENMAYGSDDVKEYMKKDGVEPALDTIEADNAQFDDVKRAVKAVRDALNRRLIELEPLPLLSLKPNMMEKKSAKDLFGDTEKKVDKITELPQAVKNFLLAGALLMKHSNTAMPRSRHVYVTPDLKFLVWKDPKKPLHPKNKMKTFKIRSVERGRCTPQLQRKRFGKFLAKEECAFAINGRERTVDLECPTEAERDKWMNYLELLIAYRKGLKAVNTQFTSR